MLVSWSWEWASCTIFSRAVVDSQNQTIIGFAIVVMDADHLNHDTFF